LYNFSFSKRNPNRFRGYGSTFHWGFIKIFYTIAVTLSVIHIGKFKKTTGSYEKPGGKKTGYEAVV
jgi:hypothetical protein